MTDQASTDQKNLPGPKGSNRKVMLGGVALAVLVVGAAAGAGGTKLAQRWQPQSVMLLEPAPITQLKDDQPAAAKGNVAEIFGNKFILQDSSGRVLVDLGPRGDRGAVVSKDEAVTVQGRFDRGVIRAQVLVHADGRSEAFGPPRPPHPDRGPPPPGADRGPPPPPGADRGPPPPPADAPPR